MNLVGVIKIVSKKTGSAWAKICLVGDEVSSPVQAGSDVAFEFLPFDEEYFELIGHKVEILYNKGSNGKAYAKGLTVVA